MASKSNKICSGNPKFFWLFIYNPFYSQSQSHDTIVGEEGWWLKWPFFFTTNRFAVLSNVFLIFFKGHYTIFPAEWYFPLYLYGRDGDPSNCDDELLNRSDMIGRIDWKPRSLIFLTLKQGFFKWGKPSRDSEVHKAAAKLPEAFRAPSNVAGTQHSDFLFAAVRAWINWLFFHRISWKVWPM